MPMLLAAQIGDLWYALPLIVSVSLVYSASRYERMSRILVGSLRSALWVTGFMALLFVFIYWLTSGL